MRRETPNSMVTLVASGDKGLRVGCCTQKEVCMASDDLRLVVYN